MIIEGAQWHQAKGTEKGIVTCVPSRCTSGTTGKKSISLQIKIMWDGNMTSEQIGAVMQKAIDAVSKVGWELRG